MDAGKSRDGWIIYGQELRKKKRTFSHRDVLQKNHKRELGKPAKKSK